MFADIRNFITIRWDKTEIEPPPPWITDCSKSLDKHIEIHEKLFAQFTKQIRIIYPKATLHVITNKPLKNKDKLIFHKMDVPSNHLSKLHMYGLIDEPAMYIDTDVIIVSKFLDKHIDVSGPFNYYKSGGERSDLHTHAKKDLPVQIKYLYNAGLVWIASPSPKIVEDMQYLHEEYFHRKEVEDRIGFQIGDEHSSSLYSAINNIKFHQFDEINVLRGHVTNMQDCQTVHYTGYDLKHKEQCLDEFKTHCLAYRII